jgi:hypothetical protein
MEKMYMEDTQNRLVALEQIVDTANSLNDPTEFTFQVAAILRNNGLISESAFEILTGQL